MKYLLTRIADFFHRIGWHSFCELEITMVCKRSGEQL